MDDYVLRDAFEAGFRAGFNSGAPAMREGGANDMAIGWDAYKAGSTHALLTELEARVKALEQGHGGIRLGPDPIPVDPETLKRVVDAAEPPVDRTQVTTTSGEPADVVKARQQQHGGTGMFDSYIVLKAEERAKGFVRPLRKSYKHLKCGGFTGMGKELMETYARDPGFYQNTFCLKCNAHYPVSEFVWELDGKKVGS